MVWIWFWFFARHSVIIPPSPFPLPLSSLLRPLIVECQSQDSDGPKGYHWYWLYTFGPKGSSNCIAFAKTGTLF
ncbi:hypothetical protein F4781DRAFT_408356 [Annulohypoxylon bovei var. microspora]|nr:hypothetical protein F4781DRAFT_408356 [Annulohypoxylon bovei var. microspora]